MVRNHFGFETQSKRRVGGMPASDDVDELERRARQQFADRPGIIVFIDFVKAPVHPRLGGPIESAEQRKILAEHLNNLLSAPPDILREFETAAALGLAAVRRIIETGSNE